MLNLSGLIAFLTLFLMYRKDRQDLEIYGKSRDEELSLTSQCFISMPPENNRKKYLVYWRFQGGVITIKVAKMGEFILSVKYTQKLQTRQFTLKEKTFSI